MIKLGKLTDYAVVVMVQLSKEGPDGMRSASALAAKTGIPEPTVAKVLKQLAEARLVESVRGAGGGYKMRKPAAQVTVADVVVAMDGPISLVSCVEGSGETCKSEAACPTRGGWDTINRAIRQALESVTIAAMGSGGERLIQIKSNVSHA